MVFFAQYSPTERTSFSNTVRNLQQQSNKKVIDIVPSVASEKSLLKATRFGSEFSLQLHDKAATEVGLESLPSTGSAPQKPQTRSALVTMSLTTEDVNRVIYGAAAFAGGGGGAKKWGELFLKACKPDSDGVICETVSLAQLQDDDLIVPAAMMGSPDSLADSSKGYDQFLSPLALSAKDAWNANAGTPMKYAVGVEVGGTNSIVPMFVANASNQGASPDDKVYVIDGDLQGRAVQSLVQLGPYMFGLSTEGTCFSYVSKESGDGPVPSPPEGAKLLHSVQVTVTPSGGASKKFWVLGCAVPSYCQTAQDSEAYLSTVILNYALADTVIAVVFGGLKRGDLMKQGRVYNCGTYTPVCTPNTITRSLTVGDQLIRGGSAPYNQLFAPLQAQGAVLYGQGRVTNLVTGGSARSDVGYWTVTLFDGTTVLTTYFNNENVAMGIQKTLTNPQGPYTSEFTPITTAPNGITVQSLVDLYNPQSTGPDDQYLAIKGECFSNDELTSIMKILNGSEVFYVNVYATPPAPLTFSYEALKRIGPAHWHMAEGFPQVKGLDTMEYSPLITEYMAPQYYYIPIQSVPTVDAREMQKLKRKRTVSEPETDNTVGRASKRARK